MGVRGRGPGSRETSWMTSFTEYQQAAPEIGLAQKELTAFLAALTCSTIAGTEKIMASLKMGLVSSLFTEVFFLLIFRPSWSRYTLTNGSVPEFEMKSTILSFIDFPSAMGTKSNASYKY